MYAQRVAALRAFGADADNVPVRVRLGPFAHPLFAVYWSGGLVSNVGTWLQNVAGAVFVYERTGSALAVGILNFASFLPILLLSVFGGVISDRFDRRLVIVVTHVGSLTVAAGLAALTIAGATAEVHVIATAFLLQTSWAIAKPSMTAILPALVPRAQLAEAVSLNTLQFILAQLVGPLLATALLATVGFGWAFSINAATYLAPIAAVLYLYSRRVAGAAARATEGAGRSGPLAYVRAQPWILPVLLATISTSAIVEVVRTAAPALVSTRLDRPAADAGLIVAAQSVGMAAGIVASVVVGRRGRPRVAAPVGLVFQLAGLLAAANATDLLTASLAVALVGSGFSLCFPVLAGTLQTEVPDAVRGRVLALHQMSHLGNRPFTALGAGALAGAFGAAAAFLGAIALVPVGLVAIRAAWRGLDREAAGPLGAAARTAP